jgi:hypothetical protein
LISGIVLISLYVIFLVTTLALDEYTADSYNPTDPRAKAAHNLNSVDAVNRESFGEMVGEGVR